MTDRLRTQDGGNQSGRDGSNNNENVGDTSFVEGTYTGELRLNRRDDEGRRTRIITLRITSVDSETGEVQARLSGGDFDGSLLVGLYVLVLAALTVNRFILAGLGAALPKTLDRSLLVTANAITPTVGTGAFGVGFGVGFGIRFLLGAGAATDALVITAAAPPARARTPSPDCASSAR